MKRVTAAILCICLLLHVLAPAALAGVNVNRGADENPMKEVAKSVIYGGMAGLVIGGAISWASESGNGDAVRWGFVTGTFVGLGMGIWWVTKRPPASAAIEWKSGELRAQLPTPGAGGEGQAQLTLARVRF